MLHLAAQMAHNAPDGTKSEADSVFIIGDSSGGGQALCTLLALANNGGA